MSLKVSSSLSTFTSAKQRSEAPLVPGTTVPCQLSWVLPLDGTVSVSGPVGVAACAAGAAAHAVTATAAERSARTIPLPCICDPPVTAGATRPHPSAGKLDERAAERAAQRPFLTALGGAGVTNATAGAPALQRVVSPKATIEPELLEPVPTAAYTAPPAIDTPAKLGAPSGSSPCGTPVALSRAVRKPPESAV